MSDVVETTHETDDERTEESASRRALMTKGAIAAAVGAAGGLLVSNQASAGNTDGSSLQIGTSNSSNGPTTTSLFSSTLRVSGGGTTGNASVYGIADGTGNSDYGVRGTYNTPTGSNPAANSAGVYGTSNGSGVPAVYGEASSTTASVGVKGKTTVGDGVMGETSGVGAGVYGLSAATSGRGVRGRATATGGQGVYGESTGSQASGIYGEHKGESTRSGTGVRGVSDTGPGISGAGSTFDVVAVGSGKMQLGAVPSTPPGPTASGTLGTIARGADGTMWYCYASSKWRRISGPTVAGAFTAVTPFRVYDSRKETAGTFSGGSNRTISVADSRNVDTYAVVTAGAVPEGATAVVGNVVAIGTSDTGFMAINPGGITAITAATVNWAPGQNIGNAGTFTLNATRQLEAVFGPGAGCHLTIDITGYYL